MQQTLEIDSRARPKEHLGTQFKTVLHYDKLLSTIRCLHPPYPQGPDVYITEWGKGKHRTDAGT